MNTQPVAEMLLSSKTLTSADVVVTAIILPVLLYRHAKNHRKPTKSVKSP